MIERIDYFRGQYNFLSNFYHSPFKASLYGTATIFNSALELVFNTNEHYFQASKATTFKEAKEVANARTPRHAKHLGNAIDARSDWDEIKLNVMLAGLRYKFAIPVLRDKLLATGDILLYEGNTWNDRYWGVTIYHSQRVGENHLGRLLMQVREELQIGGSYVVSNL